MSWQELEPPLAVPATLLPIDADKLTVFALKCQIYCPESESDASNAASKHAGRLHFLFLTFL